MGFSELTIAALLGHASRGVTQRYIHIDEALLMTWIKTPNEAFDDRSALDVMLGGELTDLIHLRRYLDAERGGW